MFSFKKLSILALLTTFILGFTISMTYAQTSKESEQPEKYEFNGRVLDDKSGEAISNAEVHIVEKEKKVKTGEDGRFTFKKLPAGTHTLKIEKDGYKKWERKVTVKEEVRVVIRVKPESSN